jgi:hypothetical protein
MLGYAFAAASVLFGGMCVLCSFSDLWELTVITAAFAAVMLLGTAICHRGTPRREHSPRRTEETVSSASR